MKLIEEIAHRHNARADRVTDFYFFHAENGRAERFKVTETASATKIVGGEVSLVRYDYVVSIFRPTGWVDVLRIGEEHVDTAAHAARVAHNVILGG